MMILWKKFKKLYRSELIQSCSELPLSIFIRCLLHHDYSGLVLKGNPNEGKIVNAWENIYQEYIELSDNQYFKKLIALYKDIGELQSRIYAVELGLFLLANGRNQMVINNLNKLGYKRKWTDETYQSDLENIKSRINSAKLMIKIKEKQIEELMKENHKPVRESDFDKVLTVMSKYQGYRIRKEDITVSEFIYIQYNMRRETEKFQEKMENLSKK